MLPIRVILGLSWGYMGIMEEKMETTIMGCMGGCHNYGPFLDPYPNTAPNIQGAQKVTIIFTTTHIEHVISVVLYNQYGWL